MLHYLARVGFPVHNHPYLVHNQHNLHSPQLLEYLVLLNQPSHQPRDSPCLDHNQASKLDHGQALNQLPRQTFRAFLAILRRQ